MWPSDKWWMDLAIPEVKVSEVGEKAAKIPCAKRAIRNDIIIMENCKREERRREKMA